MLGKFNKIFAPKRTEKKFTISSFPDEIKKDEEKAEKDLALSFQKTEEIFNRIAKEIGIEIAALKIKEKEEVSHPKLEKIGKTALPNFVKSMEHVRVPRFSGDADIYYEDSALLLNQYVKAQQGAGKYLHLIFSDEMKRIRKLVGSIGEEVNTMTSSLKNCRERRESYKRAKELLQDFSDSSAKIQAIQKELEDIEIKVTDLQGDRKVKQEKLSDLLSSSEGKENEDLRKRCETCRQELSLENCRLNAVVHPIITVYRKSRSIISKTGTSRIIRSFDEIKEIIEGSPPFNTDKLGPLFEETIPLIKSLAGSGQINLKGKDEQQVISGDYELTREISQAQTSYIRINDEIAKIERMIEESSTEKTISSLNKEIEKINLETEELVERRKKRLAECKEIKESIPGKKEKLKKIVKKVYGEEAEISFPENPGQAN